MTLRLIFLLFYVCSVCLFSEEIDDPSKNTQEEKMASYSKTSSGLLYKIMEAGTGNYPAAGDIVSVHYIGKLEDGTQFDSSHDRQEPLEFELGVGQVIKGWDEGLALLKKGGSALLVIPPELGYGNRQIGPIPANSTLYFEVSLIDIKPGIKIEPFNIQGKASTTTDSGLEFILVEMGSGLRAAAGNTVSVHYTGYFQDGSIFDSSLKRGQPYEFILGMGRVIAGWDEGVALMKEGDKARLIIPYYLAYGERGYGPIPAKATLIFDIELLKVK